MCATCSTLQLVVCETVLVSTVLSSSLLLETTLSFHLELGESCTDTGVNDFCTESVRIKLC